MDLASIDYFIVFYFKVLLDFEDVRVDEAYYFF